MLSQGREPRPVDAVADRLLVKDIEPFAFVSSTAAGLIRCRGHGIEVSLLCGRKYRLLSGLATAFVIIDSSPSEQ